MESKSYRKHSERKIKGKINEKIGKEKNSEIKWKGIFKEN